MPRIETDHFGEVSIPDDVLYGIQSYRARLNFPDESRFDAAWYKAMATVKLACYNTIRRFAEAVHHKYEGRELPIQLMKPEVLYALAQAAREASQGDHFDHFIVPGLSGGAGTSINMNVNEILANRAAQLLGSRPGDYSLVHPIEHANAFQSTNDVVPTALRIAVMQLLGNLEEAINKSRSSLEILECNYRNGLRIGYTQMQEAVPSSFGKLFSTYSEALSRDWWRVSKCFERIKVVNIGGGAIGTSLGIPLFFVMEVAGELRQLTSLPLTRSENPCDTTANLDAFVEVHAILKSHAVNIEKMSSDIRLLSSDLVNGGLRIPGKQLGSTIMPGKINPVIIEYAVSVAHKIYANDNLISSLCGMGTLELNAYLPLVGHTLLDSLKSLISVNHTLNNNLLTGLVADTDTTARMLLSSPAVTTALTPHIGYDRAARLAYRMKEGKLDIFAANRELALVDEDQLKEILKPENLLQAGFRMEDIMGPDHSDN